MAIFDQAFASPERGATSGKSPEAQAILDAGKEARRLDPSLAKQESEGLKGKDINFRPEDIKLAGVGEIKSTRTKGGNFTIDATEDEQTGIFRDILQGGATGDLAAARGLSPDLARAGGQAFDAAGKAFDSFGSFDPMTAAQERFDKLDTILGEGRERTRSGLESRLFAQGRLDSTAGSRELADLEAGFQRERAGMLDQQFGQAQTAQSNLAGIAQGLTGTGAGVQSGIFNQGLQGIGGAQQLSEPMMRLLGLGQDLGNSTVNAKVSKETLKQSADAAEGGGGFMSGIGGQILGGLATGAATAFGGPLGGMAAQPAIGGMTGGGGGNAVPEAQGMTAMFG